MSSRGPVSAIVLAAGQGTRMKSALPKVLHPAAGRPLVEWVVAALTEAGVEKPVVVVGHGREEVQQLLDGRCLFAVQEEQRGTGHAAGIGFDALGKVSGSVLVLAGDTPLLRAQTLIDIIERQQQKGAKAALATCTVADPTGYGRIVRDTDGHFRAIVEHKDCTPEQLAISEINPAVYCFDAQALAETLPKLSSENAQGELYLTDVLGHLVAAGEKVESVEFDDEDEFMGVNDRWQLAEAGRILRDRTLERHAKSGVTFIDPGSIWVGPDVEIGPETVVRPNTMLEGKTVIGPGSSIGPNTWIKDTTIGADAEIFMSHLDGARLGDKCRCGPFANIRPKSSLEDGVKIGNFVEIKNSALGPGVAASHLTYIGDSEVGARTNIGAGTITCNYNGFDKSATVIGEDCFIGSNSTLIAPVTIGDEAMVAAGSTINRDVPAGSMAIGRSQQENKEGWFRTWRQKKKGTNA